jgi:acetyltransferase-like isoleucine patch superfamily enzyme
MLRFFRNILKGVLVRLTIQLRFKRIYLGRNLTLVGNSQQFIIQNNVYISDKCILHCTGLESKIKIGANSYIGECSNIRANNSVIIIGENCKIAQFVSIIGNNYDTQWNADAELQLTNKQKTNKVIIGDNVWIGASTTILPGISICSNSIIGANSIITKSILKPGKYYGKI